METMRALDNAGRERTEYNTIQARRECVPQSLEDYRNGQTASARPASDFKKDDGQMGNQMGPGSLRLSTSQEEQTRRTEDRIRNLTAPEETARQTPASNDFKALHLMTMGRSGPASSGEDYEE